MAGETTPTGEFVEELSSILSDRLFRTADIGLHVVDVSSGESVLAANADKPMVPASTMKVLTAAVALRQLGPAHRYVTSVYVDGDVDAEGTLKGDVYVEGTGDPTLVVERLWKLVHELKLRGIQRIEGRVRFDETYFDDTYELPGWNKKRDIQVGPSYFSTLSALSLNHNTVAILIRPGMAAGQPARVSLETEAGDYIQLDNEVTTGAAGSWPGLTLERLVEGGTMRFVVRGSVPSDDERRVLRRTVHDPTAHFAAAFAAMLQQHGIRVTRGFDRAEVPDRAEWLMNTVSPPLSAILMDMNKRSSNFIAEQVLRTVAAEASGESGTTVGGLQVVQDYLAGLGIEEGSFQLVNGSGLSRTATLTPQVLTAVMRDMALDPKLGPEFQASLSIAGVDGTLIRRLREDPSRVRGKTGTIDGVHCLAGLLDADDGKRYAFAFLVNGIRGSSAQARALHDRFARQMFVVEGEERSETPEESDSERAGDQSGTP